MKKFHGCVITLKNINLPRNATARLSYPGSRNSQGQEMFLALSAEKTEMQDARSHVNRVT